MTLSKLLRLSRLQFSHVKWGKRGTLIIMNFYSLKVRHERQKRQRNTSIINIQSLIVQVAGFLSQVPLAFQVEEFKVAFS